MNIEKFYSYNQFLSENGIIYTYSGEFSQKILEEIGSVIKARLEMNETAPTVTQKIFSVFVEQAQNVMKYSYPVIAEKTKSAEMKLGSLVIGQENETDFFVMSGNYISNNERDTLVSYIEKFRFMSADELKAFYKEKLKSKPDISSNNAGLGLIDMARKATRPIEYFIEPAGDSISFFSIKAVI